MVCIIFAFMIGGIIGIFTMSIFAAKSDKDAYVRGYTQGREDERARILEQVEEKFVG